jgi:protein-tyrosine-phosphatase
MAEALARKLNKKDEIEFLSAGTEPEKEVDPKAIDVLKEENIHWQGRPKSISEIEKPDVIVTMGCGVVCPTILGAKTIEWDIPDPKGKSLEDYRKTLNLIKEKVFQLLAELK